MKEFILLFAILSILYTLSNQYLYNLFFYIFIILLLSIYILFLYPTSLSFLPYFLLIIQIGAISILFGIAIMLIQPSISQSTSLYSFLLTFLLFSIIFFSSFPTSILTFLSSHHHHILAHIGLYWYTLISYSISLIILTLLLLFSIFALFILLHFSI